MYFVYQSTEVLFVCNLYSDLAIDIGVVSMYFE